MIGEFSEGGSTAVGFFCMNGEGTGGGAVHFFQLAACADKAEIVVGDPNAGGRGRPGGAALVPPPTAVRCTFNDGSEGRFRSANLGYINEEEALPVAVLAAMCVTDCTSMPNLFLSAVSLSLLAAGGGPGESG